MSIRLRFTAITFWFLLSLAGIASDPPHVQARLDPNKVRNIAEEYVTEHGLAAKDVSIRDVIYIAENEFWLVIYVSKSNEIGGHGFGLIIYDDDPTRISLQPGL